MNKYLDIEVIVTKRIYLSDDCNVEAIKEKLSENNYDITEKEGFIECEYLSETEMLHEEDDTFEGTKQPVMMDLYENDKIIYQNSIL